MPALRGQMRMAVNDHGFSITQPGGDGKRSIKSIASIAVIRFIGFVEFFGFIGFFESVEYVGSIESVRDRTSVIRCRRSEIDDPADF